MKRAMSSPVDDRLPAGAGADELEPIGLSAPGLIALATAAA